MLDVDYRVLRPSYLKYISTGLDGKVEVHTHSLPHTHTLSHTHEKLLEISVRVVDTN